MSAPILHKRSFYISDQKFYDALIARFYYLVNEYVRKSHLGLCFGRTDEMVCIHAKIHFMEGVLGIDENSEVPLPDPEAPTIPPEGTDQNNYSSTIEVNEEDLSGTGTIKTQIAAYINTLDIIKRNVDADIWVDLLRDSKTIRQYRIVDIGKGVLHITYENLHTVLSNGNIDNTVIRQNTPSAHWIFPNPLSRIPDVTTLNLNGSQMFGIYSYNENTDQVEIKFNVPVPGIAILS